MNQIKIIILSLAVLAAVGLVVTKSEWTRVGTSPPPVVAPPAQTAPPADAPISASTFIPDSVGIVMTDNNTSNKTLLPVGKMAPNFEFKDLNGQRVSLKEMRGKVVLLDFWATWCVPCQDTTPVLQGLHARNFDKGLRVIGISLDHPETVANVTDFVHQLGVTYPIAATPYQDYKLSLKYHVDPLPSLFLIDKKGVIRWLNSGYGENEWIPLEHNIKVLLNEN